LTLARSVERAAATWSAADAVGLRDRFDRELEPHFLVEELVLLPALRNTELAELCARVEQDHALLRESAARAANGDGAAAISFSAALTAHVRFEERELFPACEQLLPDEVLDEVARRAPKAP
jgi:hemerythrin-like domain-containing protein